MSRPAARAFATERSTGIGKGFAMGTRLYVGNLPYDTDEDSIKTFFEGGGARQVRQLMPDALLVFLAPPSWEELERRLRGRGTESAEVVQARLDTARIELAAEDEFDATIVNTSVEEAAEQLVGLIRAG